MRKTSGIVLMLVMGLMVCQAGAATVIFQDDFEGAEGVSPYTWQQQTENGSLASESDPNNALIGAWAVNYESLDWDIQATSSSPGAYAGSNYLRVHRSSGAADALARFEPTAHPVSTEFQIRVDAGSAMIGSTLTPAELTGNSSDWADNARFILLFDAGGILGVTNAVYYSSSGGWTDTGLRYTSGWNSLSFVTDMATGKASVTLNGTTVNNLSLLSTGNTNAVIVRGADDGHEFSVDSPDLIFVDVQDYLCFYDSDTQVSAMVIQGDIPRVGINTNSPSETLDVDGNIKSSGMVIATDLVTKGPWVDVRAFGAKGDGTTDDASAIQSALDSIQGGTVFFPNGTYIIGTTLVPGSNVTLMGQNKWGATLKTKASTQLSLLTIIGKANVSVVGLSFDGNRDNQTDGQNNAIQNAILLCGSENGQSNFVIKDCYFKKFLQPAIYIGGTYAIKRVTLDGCHATASKFLLLGNAIDLQISNNFTDTIDDTSVLVTGASKYVNIIGNNLQGGDRGICVGGSSGDSPTEVNIIGNVVRNTSTFGIVAGFGARRFTIANNITTGCGTGTDGAGIIADLSENDYIYDGSGVITGNVSYDNNGHGLYLNKIKNTVVSNNIFRENSNNGICISGSGPLTITGNQVIGNSGAGIETHDITSEIDPNQIDYSSGEFSNNRLSGNGGAICMYDNANTLYTTCGRWRFFNNPGFTTEFGGVETNISVGTTGLQTRTVNHNLAVTPTADWFDLTCANPTANFGATTWVSNITSTQFTINVYVTMSAVGQTTSVAWRASQPMHP